MFKVGVLKNDMAELKSIAYIYYIFFTGYAIDRYLGQFWNMSVVGNAK